MWTPENPNLPDPDNEPFKPVHYVHPSCKEWMVDMESQSRRSLGRESMYTLSAYALNLDKMKFFQDVSDDRVDDIQKDIYDLSEKDSLNVKDKLNSAVTLLLHGIEPKITLKQLREVEKVLVEQKSSLIEFDSKAEKPYHWEEFLEGVFNLKLLNELPDNFLNQEIRVILSKCFLSDLNRKVRFSNLIEVAAKMKVIGCEVQLPEYFWGYAREWVEVQEVSMEEDQDIDMVYEDFLIGSGSLAILAAEKVEIPPEGGLMLDGIRVGKPLD